MALPASLLLYCDRDARNKRNLSSWPSLTSTPVSSWPSPGQPTPPIETQLDLLKTTSQEPHFSAGLENSKKKWSRGEATPRTHPQPSPNPNTDTDQLAAKKVTQASHENRSNLSISSNGGVHHLRENADSLGTQNRTRIHNNN